MINIISICPLHPPPFLRCSSTARPRGTGRGAEEVRGKAGASIDQPPRAGQATKEPPARISRFFPSSRLSSPARHRTSPSAPGRATAGLRQRPSPPRRLKSTGSPAGKGGKGGWAPCRTPSGSRTPPPPPHASPGNSSP